MQVYVYYVHDDRRDAPVQRRMNLHGPDDARRQAERILRETYHHQSVEVWSEGARVMTIRDGEADGTAERISGLSAADGGADPP